MTYKISISYGDLNFNCPKIVKNAKGYYTRSNADIEEFCDRCKNVVKCVLFISNENNKMVRKTIMEKEGLVQLDKLERFDKLEKTQLIKMKTYRKPKELKKRTPATLAEMREEITQEKKMKLIKHKLNKRIVNRERADCNRKFVKYIRTNTMTVSQANALKEETNRFSKYNVDVNPDYYIQDQEDIERIKSKVNAMGGAVPTYTYKLITRKIVVKGEEFEQTTYELEREKGTE